MRSLLLVFLVFCLQLIVAQSNEWSTDIPLVKIDTEAQQISSEETISSKMSIIYVDGARNHYDDEPNVYNGNINIKLRGTTSLSFPKKQYRIETQTPSGENLNVPLLGMPAENDWILSAPYSDKSLVRNALVYELYRRMGHYAPRTVPCELFVNGQYRGLYQLTEKIKKDVGRLDLNDLGPEAIEGDDITGGYLLKIDRGDGNGCFGWNTSIGGVYIQFEYPKCPEVHIAQRQYIREVVDEFESGLFNSDSDKLWTILDLRSVVDYFIINEISKNIDAPTEHLFVQRQ